MKKTMTRMVQGMKDELSLRNENYWQISAMLSGLFGIFLLFLLFGDVVIHEPLPDGFIGIFGIVLLLIGNLIMIAIIGSLFCIDFTTGIRYSCTRRAMLARLTFSGVLHQLCALLTIRILSKVYVALAFALRGKEADIVETIAYIPFWGWVLIGLLPISIGALGGAVILRFGKKGFWVLYAIFMGAVLSPTVFDEHLDPIFEAIGNWMSTLSWNTHLQGMWQLLPVAGAVVILIPYAIAVGMLWRAPVRE